MASGKFGETMTSATAAAVKTTKSPWAAITAAAFSLIIAGGEAWLSSRHAEATDVKSAAAEAGVAKAVEGNAASLVAALKEIEDLRRDRDALEQEFRKSVIALQDVVKGHDKKLVAMSIRAEVEARVRLERRRGGTSFHSSRHANRGPTLVRAPIAVKRQPTAAAKLSAPNKIKRKVSSSLDVLRKKAQARKVPRVWSK